MFIILFVHRSSSFNNTRPLVNFISEKYIHNYNLFLIIELNYRQAKTGKLMIDILPDKCDFCGCCVGVCPEDAIELKGS